MDTYERIEQLALLVMGLNKRVDVLEARLSPQDSTPKPESPEGTPPPAATVAPKSLAGPSPSKPAVLLPEALRAYQERCKQRLVAKAQEDPDRLPYWHRHAVTCGWILPTEGIEAILGNVTPVFWLDPDKDAASQTEDVKAQFASMEAAVAKLAESNSPF